MNDFVSAFHIAFALIGGFDTELRGIGMSAKCQ
jgi:hypothetical protein